MLNFINNGDVSAWGTNEFTGDYAELNKIAAFFDNGNFFYSPTDAGWDPSVLTTNLSNYLEQNIAGVALNVANWYILRNAYNAADCEAQPTGKIMSNDNNYCYTLEQPGEGYSSTADAFPRSLYSVPMTNDTYTSLVGFGVDLVDLYTSSWDCQGTANGAGAYDVLGNFTYDALTFTTTVPTCFYNLPVLSVVPAGDLWDSTPCDILRNNVTATVQQAGITYLPDNLEAIFGAALYCCTSSVTGKGGGVVYECATSST